MVGTDRWRVIDWEKNGAIPDSQFRRRLADLSDGRYSPSDFTVDPERRSAEVAELLGLSTRVEEVRRDIDADRKTIQRLSRELKQLREGRENETEEIVHEVIRRLSEAS